jgi:hypothetical protein
MVTESERGAKTNTIYKCPSCTWFRNITTDLMEKLKIIDHPIYGLVTVEQAARLDIKNHDCGTHMLAVEMLRETYGPMRNFKRAM